MKKLLLMSVLLVGCAQDVEFSNSSDAPAAPVKRVLPVPLPTPIVITEPAVITVEEASVEDCPLGGQTVLSNAVPITTVCAIAVEVEVPVPTECDGPGKSDEDHGKAHEDHGQNNETHGKNGK